MRANLLKSGWALLLLATTACAPTYLLNVRPAQPSSPFAEGREQAHAAVDSVEVRLNFVAFEPKRMVFNVEYRNTSSRPLLVDPTAFRYVPTRVAGPAYSRKTPAPKVARGAEVPAAVAAGTRPLPALPSAAITAFDPEQEISTLHDQADHEAARANRPDWLGLALVVASVAADVSSVGQRESSAHRASRVALHEGAVAYSIAANASRVQHAVTAEVLQGQAATLQDFALRKLTLEPGQQVRGYLYFPRFDTADGLAVSVPVGGQVVPLEFMQTRARR